MAQVSVMYVARSILDKRGAMTTMKLQKLVYYCQAWNLVWRDAPLFNESIEAWAGGPVVRSLYDAHRGKFTVSAGDLPPVAVGALSVDDNRTIDTVLAHYGDLSGQQLSDLTHAEVPWQEARKGLAITARGDVVIDPVVMAEYYTVIARQARISG